MFSDCEVDGYEFVGNVLFGADHKHAFGAGTVERAVDFDGHFCELRLEMR